MRRGWYLILSICLVMIGVFVYDLMFMNRIDTSHQADKGIFDLQAHRLTDDHIVSLNGEWMLDHTSSSVSDKRYIRVPGTWDLQSQPFSSMGTGTYHLEIRLHKDQLGDTMGLYIPNVATAYEVWIDGKLSLKNGTIGSNAEEMVPANYARTHYFVPESTSFDLSIHVANFSQRKGGLWDTIYLGTADAISMVSETRIGLQLLLVGVLLMMSIYLMIIYFLSKSQISAFYLGLLTLLIALRTLLTGETFFIRILPVFPWEFQVKLEYLTMILSVPLFIRYIHHLYPGEGWLKMQKGIDVVSILFTVLVVFTPARIYTHFLVIYQLIALPIILYLLYFFTKALISRRETSLINFICFLIFIATCVNDVLYYLQIINTEPLATKGFIVFLMSQTLVHAIQYTNAFRHVENLSKELYVLNQSLEQKVEDRTKELKQLNARLQQAEHSRKALISDVSHELSGPLTLVQGYVEAIQDHKIPSEHKYWTIIYEKTKLLKRLIHDLSSLSELEARKIKMKFQPVMAIDVSQHIYDHFQGELEAGGYELTRLNQEEWSASLPAEAYVMMDRDRIDQVMMNVIHNAVKYSGEDKKIFMDTQWVPVDTGPVEHENGRKIGDLIMKVIDNGSGIQQHDLPHIFKRLYRGSNVEGVDQGSRGLGLAISKEIMEIHNGAIWAESNEDQGSTFYISLPIYTTENSKF